MAPTSLWRGPEWNGLPILCTEHLCLPGINKRHASWYQEIKVQRDRESCTSHTPLWKCLSFHLNQEHHPLRPLPHPSSCISGPWIFSDGIECLPGERRASDQLQEAWPSRTAREADSRGQEPQLGASDAQPRPDQGFRRGQLGVSPAVWAHRHTTFISQMPALSWVHFFWSQASIIFS